MKKCILIFFGILIIGAVSFAATPSLNSTLNQLRTKKYYEPLNFKGMKLDDALSIMSYISNIDIKPNENIKSIKLNIKFNKNTSFYEILETIIKKHKFEFSFKDGELFLQKKSLGLKPVGGEIIGQVLNHYGQPLKDATIKLGNSATLQTKTNEDGRYTLKNVPYADYILHISAKNYNKDSEIVAVTATKNPVVNLNLGKPITKTKQIITRKGVNQKLGIMKDKETGKFISTKMLYVNSSDIGNIHTTLKKLMPKITTIVDEQNSLIIIKGTPKEIRAAVEIVENIDRNVKQVLIRAKIIDISKTAAEELGFGWKLDSGGRALEIFKGSGITDNSLLSYVFQGGSFSGSVGMLSTIDEAETKSEPNIMVINGKSATIAVTEERQIGSKTTVTDGISTTTPIFKEAGTTLTITPIIKNDDTVILTINTQVTTFKAITGTSQVATKGSTASTEVRLKNKETLVIGGLENIDESTYVEKTPFLSDIPLLGVLFKKSVKKKFIRKIYIELTPEIIDIRGNAQ